MPLLKSYFSLFSSCLLLAFGTLQAQAFDNNRNDNVAVYWGQNSYGANNPGNTAGWQKPLATYCQDDAIDAIPLAFLHVFFSTGGLPQIDLSNGCSPGGVFPGTNLANCQNLASDIRTCQAKGKIVTISLGGATGEHSFTSDDQAQAFADTVWNLFLGGSSSTRPFGDAVLDGVDLDIESGPSTGYAAFVNRIRSHASGANKRYYITGAPQCPFPDAYLGAALNSVGFDAIYIQFYNNFCGLQNYNNPNAWNFGTWDNWAKTQAPNKNVKIYIGAPAAPSAANAGQGYVDINTLTNIARTTRSQYSSFGGVMLWDASQAFANNRYDLAIKRALQNGGTPGTPPTTPPPPPSGGSCAGVAAWSPAKIYVAGDRATYNGHLWAAKWWTQGETPGTVTNGAQVWEDRGSCGGFVPSATPTTGTTAAPIKATPGKANNATDSTKLPATSATAGPSNSHRNATEANVEELPGSRKSSRFFKA